MSECPGTFAARWRCEAPLRDETVFKLPLRGSLGTSSSQRERDWKPVAVGRLELISNLTNLLKGVSAG